MSQVGAAMVGAGLAGAEGVDGPGMDGGRCALRRGDVLETVLWKPHHMKGMTIGLWGGAGGYLVGGRKGLLFAL